MSWRCLGASWTCLGENVEQNVEGNPKWRQKSIKFALKMQLAFHGDFKQLLWFFMLLKVSWWRHVSFFRSYFASIFLLICCWFQILRNLKNRAPVQAGALFLQNRCFRFESKNRSKNHRNLGSKIHENLNITFANLKWKCYIFEAKKPSKWGQKSLKIRSGQVS